MLYYADSFREIDPLETRDAVAASLRRAAAAYRSSESAHSAALQTHADLVGAAIALGELHQAVADLLNPQVDDVFPETDALGVAGIEVGGCVYRSMRAVWPAGRGWVGQVLVPCRMGGAGRWRAAGEKPLPYDSFEDWNPRKQADLLDRAAQAVVESVPAGLPSALRATIPEGYAFYSLYPEMYFASLDRAWRSKPNRPVYVVVGIRSIGASLAAMVAGALREMGTQATMEALRPRGHPFDRYVGMSPALSQRIAAAVKQGAGFLVVDEGPGLTCSSFLSVVSALGSLGLEADRLAILSAWQGMPSIYASEEARLRWRSLPVFSTEAATLFDGWRSFLPFLRQSLESDGKGHMKAASPEILDLSYGRWREHFLARDRWPAIHRPTERTKVLYRFPNREEQGGSHDSGRERPPILAKFAGLGDYGKEKYARAKTLAAAGFSPPMAGQAYGFLLYHFLEGRPLARADLSPELLSRMVDYHAFVAERFPAPAAPSFELLAEVILINARDALQLDATSYLSRWRLKQEEIDTLPRAKLDGKPQPYEWLEVSGSEGRGFVKTDSADHFQDHTLVGEQSILWDLAGTCEEWEMGEGERATFLRLWASRTGDWRATALLEFYRAAYLGVRVAALHYAIHSTNEEPIRRGLQHQEFAYRRRLAALLTGEGDDR